MLKLTLSTGKLIAVNSLHVITITPQDAGSSIILTDDCYIEVLESIEDILAQIAKV